MVEINRRDKKQYGPHPHARNMIKIDGKYRSNSIQNEKVVDSINLKGATNKVVNNDKA